MTINHAEHIWFNGRLVPWDEAQVHVTAHVMHYGSSIFEGIRAYNKRIFKFDEHMDRLYNSARAIDMTIPLNKEEFKNIIIELCRRNEIENGYMRPIVTRGKGDLGLDPRRCDKGTTQKILCPSNLCTKSFTCIIDTKIRRKRF